MADLKNTPKLRLLHQEKTTEEDEEEEPPGYFDPYQNRFIGISTRRYSIREPRMRTAVYSP